MMFGIVFTADTVQHILEFKLLQYKAGPEDKVPGVFAMQHIIAASHACSERDVGI